MEAVAIKEVLGRVFEGLEGERQRREQTIIAAWEKAVGSKAVSHTQVLALKNQILVVGVDSSPWLYLLSLYKQRLAKRVGVALSEMGFPQGEIQQIHFKTVKIS